MVQAYKQTSSTARLRTLKHIREGGDEAINGLPVVGDGGAGGLLAFRIIHIHMGTPCLQGGEEGSGGGLVGEAEIFLLAHEGTSVSARTMRRNCLPSWKRFS